MRRDPKSPDAKHANQRAMIEARKGPGFGDESVEPGCECFGVMRRTYDNRLAVARGEGRRAVFLECDLALQRMVVREIDSAEAALADDPDDLELPDPAPRGQRLGIVRGCKTRFFPGFW